MSIFPLGRRAGGPHPHAGFEILTFAVEGEARDRDEGLLRAGALLLRAGDVLWMTAGSGVVHNEDVEPLGKLRILQLWVTLPSASRWVAPRFKHVAREDAPVRQEPGVEARVYSGASGAASSPLHTYLPMTVVDIRLAPNAVFEQEVPSSYNGFLYPLEGQLLVDGRATSASFGWSDRLVRVRRSVNNGSSDRRSRRVARDLVRRRATGCADRDARTVRGRDAFGPGPRVDRVCARAHAPDQRTRSVASRSQRTLFQPVDVEPALREQPRTLRFHKRVCVAQCRDHEVSLVPVDRQVMGQRVGLPRGVMVCQ